MPLPDLPDDQRSNGKKVVARSGLPSEPAGLGDGRLTEDIGDMLDQVGTPFCMARPGSPRRPTLPELGPPELAPPERSLPVRALSAT